MNIINRTAQGRVALNGHSWIYVETARDMNSSARAELCKKSATSSQLSHQQSQITVCQRELHSSPNDTHHIRHDSRKLFRMNTSVLLGIFEKNTLYISISPTLLGTAAATSVMIPTSQQVYLRTNNPSKCLGGYWETGPIPEI